MSSSKNKTDQQQHTTTTTQNTDQRVVANGLGVAFGVETFAEGSEGNTVNVEQVPQEVGDIINRAFDQTEEAIRIATSAGDTAIRAEASRADSTKQILTLGVVGLVVLAMITRGFGRG